MSLLEDDEREPPQYSNPVFEEIDDELGSEDGYTLDLDDDDLSFSGLVDPNGATPPSYYPGVSMCIVGAFTIHERRNV